MVREEALKRIHRLLEAKRHRHVSNPTHPLGGWEVGGDTADAAFATGSDEIQSQVAEIEAGELALIDRALERIREGTYGICEGCQKPIPTGRLNALPFTVHCIRCQEEIEDEGSPVENRFVDWSRVNDAWKSMDEPAMVDVGRLAVEHG